MTKIATYQYAEEAHGNGTFFYTDCGNRMYSVSNDPMKYHGKLCPKCYMNGKKVTLYMRGTTEANKYAEQVHKETGEWLPLIKMGEYK